MGDDVPERKHIMGGIASLNNSAGRDRYHITSVTATGSTELRLAALTYNDGDRSLDITDATHLQRYIAKFDGVALGRQ